MDFFKEQRFEPGRSTEDKIIYGSIASGIIIIVLGMIFYSGVDIQIGGLIMLLGLMVLAFPYGIISFLKNRAVSEMERQFPAFLKDLAESKRGGMTILDSFDSARETDYGYLNNEIKKVHNQLSWGIPFPEVIERFSKRMEDSPVIQESLSIILQSYRSGGQITSTIESVADNATMLKEVIQQKKSTIKQQLFIMYIIYFLFIGITVGVYFLMQQLLGLGSTDSGTIENVAELLGDGEGGVTNFCNGEITYSRPFCGIAQVFGFVPANGEITYSRPFCGIAQVFGFVPAEITDLGSPEAEEYAYGQMAYYKSVLFSMLMVQGACSAAVAGQISEGSPSAGVKHALIMLPLAFVIFMLVIRPMGI